jgi:aminomethyltransferase
MLKRTPLFTAHKELGAKLIEFSGWEMPVQYNSIVEEHLAVRKAAGLFDISHMGEVWVTGPGATAFLNQTFTNDLRKLLPGQGQYTLMCNEQGGVIDDLYAYRVTENEYLLVVNASRTEADVAWLQQRLASSPPSLRVIIHNASDRLGAIAVQGPRVREFIDASFSGASPHGTLAPKPSALKKNQLAQLSFAGVTILVACSGYTGEDGFEIVAPADLILSVWRKLLEAGTTCGLRACGLGARDTLRAEMGYPLYGHELDQNTTPIEAGLERFLAFDKGEFVGRGALVEQMAIGPTRRLVAFKMTARSAPPRAQYAIWTCGSSPARIGTVTSGTQSPSLGLGIGLGYVPPQFARPDTLINIDIRGRCVPALVTPRPIYRKAV